MATFGALTKAGYLKESSPELVKNHTKHLSELSSNPMLFPLDNLYEFIQMYCMLIKGKNTQNYLLQGKGSGASHYLLRYKQLFCSDSEFNCASLPFQQKKV